MDCSVHLLDVDNSLIINFNCISLLFVYLLIHSIACSMMGASHVVGIDVDQDALDLAWVNMKKLEIENLDLIKCDLNGGLLKSSMSFDCRISYRIARRICVYICGCM